MRIKKIHIQNYKSLVDFELDSPPPFCAFVGPNASGKSNIFEALEFVNYVVRFGFEAPTFFGDKESLCSHTPRKKEDPMQYDQRFQLEFADRIIIDYDVTFSENNPQKIKIIAGAGIANSTILYILDIQDVALRNEFIHSYIDSNKIYENDYEQFIDNFSRIFIGSNKFKPAPSIKKLLFNASNLSQIIGQIFQNDDKRQDFIEWLCILIPEFANIEVKKSNIDGSFEFFVYEKSSDKPFPKHLISDGTYNILALMAAVYQTGEPQFLCIEEPENGLHPQAIELLVDFFREKCEGESGHHIWLTTHSPTLVRCMKNDELVLVNKIDGQTKAKIVTNKNDLDINTDEAWLTNSLGGGTLWSR